MLKLTSNTYRAAFIVLAWLATSTVLLFYSRLIAPMVPESSFYREFLICGGQIVFQGIIVVQINRNRLMPYLVTVMTVSFGGALLLTPMFLVQFVVTSNIFYVTYFMFVAGLMFIEHTRRVKLLALPWFVSATWVLYRLLVLFIIL